MSATFPSRIQRLRRLQSMLPLPGTPEGECLIISQLLDLMPDGYGGGSEPTRRIDLNQAIASGQVDCGRCKVIDLELRGRGYAIDVLRVCQITPAQRIVDEPGDSPFLAQVRVQVPETGALLRWLLGLGDNLVVVAPEGLRLVMRDQTAKMARHYARLSVWLVRTMGSKRNRTRPLRDSGIPPRRVRVKQRD